MLTTLEILSFIKKYWKLGLVLLLIIYICALHISIQTKKNSINNLKNEIHKLESTNLLLKKDIEYLEFQKTVSTNFTNSSLLIQETSTNIIRPDISNTFYKINEDFNLLFG